jgi:hypothetical protein
MLRSRAICVSATVLLLLAAIIPLKAANQGLFQGYFNFRQVSVVNDQVFVTLDVKILNHTRADVHDAKITLQNSFLQPANLGFFPTVSVASGRAVDTTQQFVVPAAEFHLWTKGARPRFLISYVDAEGNTVQQRIELIRQPFKVGN